jgi:hypothetical protein
MFLILAHVRQARVWTELTEPLKQAAYLHWLSVSNKKHDV